MMRQILALFVFLAMTMLPAMAHAQAVSEAVETDNALSRLVSEKSGIAPGETIRVGLYQELREGWHVYWINPGDSGLPLEMEWTLPAGFSAGDIQYPVPHRQPLGPLVNYGYEGTPLFMVDLTAAEDVIPGGRVTFTADADWLICADICVPEEATLTLSLPVVASPAGFDIQGARLFSDGDRHMPAPEGTFAAEWFDLDGNPGLQLTGDFDGKEEVVFFPYQDSVIEPAGEQLMERTGDGVRLYFTSGYAYKPQELDSLGGVVAWTQGDEYHGAKIVAAKIEVPAGAAFPVPGAAGQGTGGADAVPSQSIFSVLILALIGGIILNIMPCVFPIIFLKATSLARSAQESRATVIRHGLLYTAGVLVAFLAIALALFALRAGGEQVGWGFHLQDPVTVGIFAIIIFLVGLNLAGVFEIGTSVQGAGSGLAGQGGNAGAFFTGLLAVAVAAPCIGPFLGAPLGFAVLSGQSILVGLSVFLMIGLGLALPYLLISLIPGLARILPKPGPWMVTFKQLMSFAMFATLIWLIWVLTGQTGSFGLLYLLIALLLAGMAAWAFGRSQAAGGARLFGRVFAAVAFIGAVFMVTSVATPPQSGLEKVDYSEDRLAELRAEDRPVFVDFTADWCVTCKVNEVTVLNRDAVVEMFNENSVVFMVADWTSEDPEITRALEAQGRSGVPLYLFYAPGAEKPVILPQVLSPAVMRETFSVL